MGEIAPAKMLSPKPLGLIAVLPLDQIDQVLVGVVRPSSPGQIAGVRALDELHGRGAGRLVGQGALVR